jgi:hypothetical protein
MQEFGGSIRKGSERLADRRGSANARQSPDVGGAVLHRELNAMPKLFDANFGHRNPTRRGARMEDRSRRPKPVAIRQFRTLRMDGGPVQPSSPPSSPTFSQAPAPAPNDSEPHSDEQEIHSKRLPAFLWRVGGVEGAARARAALALIGGGLGRSLHQYWIRPHLSRSMLASPVSGLRRMTHSCEGAALYRGGTLPYRSVWTRLSLGSSALTTLSPSWSGGLA